MSQKRLLEFIVGLFILIAIIAFVFLAFKVSGLTSYSTSDSYDITASFQNIGDLKVRAPVTIAGVSIGEVTDISLNPTTYEAIVSMNLARKDKIPEDSTANIYTAGLIGSNYISITPGFSETNLKNGERLQRTNQAMILQNIIGQLLYSFKSKDSKKTTTAQPATQSSLPVPEGSPS
jgi:phospholipid/cholesterol/gamma-HCH transport system substrate-binding protein